MTKCKTCSNELDYNRDLPNIKNGNNQCMTCWRKEEHSYF